MSTPVTSIIPSKRTYLLDCPIDLLTMDETVAEVHHIIGRRLPSQHCVVNAGKFVLMHRDPKLKNIVQGCAMVNVDGQSVVWTLKWLGHSIQHRVCGIDLMVRLLEESEKKHYRLFFLGARQESLDRVLELVKTRYPDVVIAGSHNGYFTTEQNDSIVRQIAESHADVLFVAMSSPKKEFWLAKHINELNVPFCMGVGGSFDVLAGFTKRAPSWVQSLGMEWFYRFIQEPRRLWRRYLIDNFVYVYLVLASLWKSKVRS